MENVTAICEYARELFDAGKHKEMLDILREAVVNDPEIIHNAEFMQLANGAIGEFLMLDYISDNPFQQP